MRTVSRYVLLNDFLSLARLLRNYHTVELALSAFPPRGPSAVTIPMSPPSADTEMLISAILLAYAEQLTAVNEGDTVIFKMKLVSKAEPIIDVEVSKLCSPDNRPPHGGDRK